jgi:hypothetical protein
MGMMLGGVDKTDPAPVLVPAIGTDAAAVGAAAV